MYMVIKVKTIIIPLLITYILIAGLISFKFANLCLAIAVVCFLAYLFSHSSKKEVVVKSYISNIPRDLLYNDNTLINSHCIVRYFPNRRIAVIDNPKSGEHTPLRIFSVDKTNYADVNACWTEVCSVFDSYMTLDNLFSFIDKNTGSINVIYLTPGTDFSVVQGVEDFIPKESLKKKEAPKPLIKNPELVKKISDKENKSAIVVDFKDLKQYDVAPANKKDYEKNVVAMSNFIDSKDKIDVNELVTITLNFETNIGAYDLVKLEYNNKVLEYVSGSPLISTAWYDNTAQSKGITSLSYTFKGKDNGKSDINIIVKGLTSANDTMDYLGDRIVSKKITVGTGIQKGDADGNGVIDSNDASTALFLYKTNSNIDDLKNCDMDNNGVIDSNDASLILELYKSSI